MIEYKSFDELATAVNDGKCAVVDVLKEYYSTDNDGSHAMVATGVKTENNNSTVVYCVLDDNHIQFGSDKVLSKVKNQSLSLS